MRTITLRAKLTTGFSVMILLILLVSVLSIFRFIDVAALGTKAVEENSQQAFSLEKEIDHLKWINDVADLFLLENVQHLEVETDYTKCGLGKWIYGSEMGVLAAENRELGSLIAKIKPPHARMHQSAEKINQVYVEFDENLIIMLERVWIDHLEWIAQLDRYIMSGSSFLGQTDPRECNFGKWYYAYAAEDPRFKELLTRWEGPHTRLHDSAEQIMRAVNNGNRAEAVVLYNQTVLPVLDELRQRKIDTVNYLQSLLTRQQNAVEIFNTETLPALEETQTALAGLIGFYKNSAARAQTEMDNRVRQIILMVLLIAFTALVGGMILAVFTTRSIMRQLGRDPGDLARIAETVAEGNLNGVEVIQGKTFGVYRSVLEMVDALKQKADALEVIASGDFSGNIALSGSSDILGTSMMTMQRALTELLGQVRRAIDQVAGGADQVSQASQSLSQGATEQASSLEEISSSITEINSQASQNAASATEANRIAVEARENALGGSRSMDELIHAMAQINEGSEEIKKVVKVIDDIAFQINLLALNANVEAARAGKYGRGFAVVAEEVRNLAARSARAVKETTDIVDVSVERSARGNKLVDETAKQLELIVNGVGKAAALLEEIASASREQAQGLSQISEGVEQIDEVTQANTASAEESASAAEELSGQADELRSLIQRFTLAREQRLLDAPD